MRTWYWRTNPPQEFTSATPGTANLRSNHPFVDCTRFGPIAAVAKHDVVKDFPEPVRHRAHLGPFDFGRQDDGGKPLRNELPGNEHVGVFVESDNDLRKPKFGDRSHRLQMRHAAERLFHRIRDASLDFFRIELRNDRIHLNLNRRDVGKRVDVQTAHRHQPQDGESQGEHNHRKAMMQREVDDSSKHLFSVLGPLSLSSAKGPTGP